jgi:nicotinamide-nucleotide amidase
MDPVLASLAQRLGAALRARRLMLATAESCTGGWAAQVVTSVSGSSEWFDCGFVTYSNEAKQEMLGVPSSTLERQGAVSEQTVRSMAEGALRRSRAQMALAITGIAGPSGGSPDKPVGTVWFAWAMNGETHTRLARFGGDREAIRRQSVVTALNGALEALGK